MARTADEEARIDAPWTLGPKEMARRVGVDPRQGLTRKQARTRRGRYGQNRIGSRRTQSWWSVLLNQFRNVIIPLPAVASLASFIFGETLQGFAIAGAVLFSVVFGFVAELCAIRSMEALQTLSRSRARLRRDGSLSEIAAADVVPGDIVLLEAGDRVPADLRLWEASRLQVDESTFTGESIPVEKSVEPLEPDTPLAERRLEGLSRRLIWITLGVAAVPEGLPVVATIALARGMWRMARRHALTQRLSSVETLGSTNLILTDKTGTLAEALRIGVLCGNAEEPLSGDPDGKPAGDPLETACGSWPWASGRASPGVMSRPPRKREEPVLTREHWAWSRQRPPPRVS